MFLAAIFDSAPSLDMATQKTLKLEEICDYAVLSWIKKVL